MVTANIPEASAQMLREATAAREQAQRLEILLLRMACASHGLPLDVEHYELTGTTLTVRPRDA